MIQFPRAIFPALLFAGAALAQVPTKEDSGWVSIFNGHDFNDFYVYIGGKGYTEVKDQTIFKMGDGTIDANGPYSLLTTTKEYSHYHMRVDYMFDPGVGDSANAGVMIHFDNLAAKTVTTGLRPRSIEINFRRDNSFPATMWSSLTYGPYITTTVQAGTQKFLPKEQGGVKWINDPWDSEKRVVHSALPLLENPPGKWNRLDVSVRGDSATIHLNGLLRTAGWHFQGRGTANDSTPANRVKIDRGGVAIQAEGFEVWYKSWEIQELDPVTGIPIHARRGCTDKTKANFDEHAVVENGSCGVSAVRPWGAKISPSNSSRWRWIYSLNGRVLKPR